jgi:hypothetical protein
VSIDTDELPESVAESLFSARQWHSGQTSALYCWASSGSAVAGLSREAREAAVWAEELTAHLESEEEITEALIESDALAALAVWAERRGL